MWSPATCLDGDTDEEDDKDRKNEASLQVIMPCGGGCSLMGDANGDDDGDDEFEIVLADSLGEEEGLSSMPESFGCSEGAFEGPEKPVDSVRREFSLNRW